MKALLEKIPQLTINELQDLMHAIENRCREDFPQMDVIFLALHKDPVLRKKELEELLHFAACHPECIPAGCIL